MVRSREVILPCEGFFAVILFIREVMIRCHNRMLQFFIFLMFKGGFFIESYVFDPGGGDSETVRMDFRNCYERNL